jgi:hypothetical protein
MNDEGATMAEHTTDPVAGAAGPSRRSILRGLALASVALGAGAAGAVGTRTFGGAQVRKKKVSLEVACLGELWREATKANPADDADFRTSFGIEGWIYPPGTIKGDGFIPRQDGSIGRWFCRGFILIDAARSEPHGSTTQDLYFGSITPDALFPPDMLTSSGLEGTGDRRQRSTRAVIGGAGEYFGATGTVTQQVIATNTSLFADGTNDPAPCWRMDFDLRLPG